MKEQIKLLTAFILTLAIGIIGTVGMAYSVIEQSERLAIVKSEISSKYTIISAKFNSPEVIIKTETVAEFLSKAEQVNATVIYLTGSDGYVAVDPDFTYAYNLTTTVDMGQWYGIFVISCAAMLAGFLLSYIFGHMLLQGDYSE